MTYGCYVHIPFCLKKCRYCNFVSFPTSDTKMDSYINTLLIEANKRAVEVEGNIETVYIGGGTPSILPTILTDKLLQGLASVLDLSAVKEWTVEANPGTVTKEWLETVLQNGCNRISFGVQAFQPRLLKILGRIHNAEEISKSIQIAREAGFSNINLDLMFGLPSQTPSDWTETLNHAVSLKPEHISAYGLIPEYGTPIKEDIDRGNAVLPNADEEREMYDMAIKLLSANGYEQYEISNFAKKGFSCAHNIGYWTQKPYLGLGLSSVSMRIIQKSQKGFIYERKTNPFCISAYTRSVMSDNVSTASDTELIGSEDSMFESLMLGLRLTVGVSEDEFLLSHGISLSDWRGGRLRYLADKGLLKHKDGRWSLTRRGMDIQNSVLIELM